MTGRAFGRPQSGAAAPAVSAESPQIQFMELKQITVLPSAAPNAFPGGAKCDSEGNLFLRFGIYDFTRAQIAQDAAISEIIPDSKRIVAYGRSPLPVSDYPNARLVYFNVTSGGSLYALISTRAGASASAPRPAPEYYLERFKDDGTVDAILRISPPPGATHWFADLLGIFRDGNFLVAGISTATTNRPGAGSWGPFTAIYDRNGRFVREVALPGDVVNKVQDSDKPTQQKVIAASSATDGGAQSGTPDKTGSSVAASSKGSPEQPSKPGEPFEAAVTTGAVFGGPDGNVWIFRSSDPIKLFDVNPMGDVVKHFEFQAPVKGLKPFNMGFAGPDEVYIHFVRLVGTPGAAVGPSGVVGVFDTDSERFESLYALPITEKAIRVLACSDHRGGFLYLGSTKNHDLALYDYRP